MRRREFIAALGAAAAAPLASHAQQRMPLVGYLHSRSRANSGDQVDAFVDGLRKAGFTEGRNVKIEYRWADGDFKKLPAMAKALAAIPVDVLAAVGGQPSAMAAKAAAPTVPIVFAMSSDPIKLGLAASVNRPGGNATGVNVLTSTMESKRLGLLHELSPGAGAIAILVDANFPPAQRELKDLHDAAPAIGVRLRVFPISNPQQIDAAFDTMQHERIAAMAVAGSPFLDTHRAAIIARTIRDRLPAIYHFREYARDGGLMSYGIDIREAHRQVGLYAGQILNGAKPGDLPIMYPTKFQLVINLKTAHTIGLTIPPTLLARADEVIE